MQIYPVFKFQSQVTVNIRNNVRISYSKV